MNPDICLVKIEEPLDDRTANFLMKFSPPEKHSRILRQRIKRIADTMIVGGALARHMLWKHFSIPPNAQISYGKFGKPYLSDFPQCHFNISHSGQYVVCAVYNAPIGVDIQQIVPYRSDVAIRVFSPAELRQIENSSDPSAEFTRLWTRMEARIKALGIGIGQAPACDTSFSYKTDTCFLEDAFVSVSYNFHDSAFNTIINLVENQEFSRLISRSFHGKIIII